mgnify:CR=1 FL=1
MKKIRKMVSLICVFALALSAGAFTANAADTDSLNDAVVVYEDENMNILVGASDFPLTRNSSGSGVASPKAYLSYPYDSSDGNRCRIDITNTSTDADINITIEYQSSSMSEPGSTEYYLEADDSMMIMIEFDGEEDTSCDIDITLEAVGASSATFDFAINQYWE